MHIASHVKGTKFHSLSPACSALLLYGNIRDRIINVLVVVDALVYHTISCVIYFVAGLISDKEHCALLEECRMCMREVKFYEKIIIFHA